MDKATFTISLDCEGLWGLADNYKIISSNVINEKSLFSAYSYIVHILERYSVKATAAFVTSFAADINNVVDCMPIINELNRLNPIWYKNIVWCLNNKKFDGWSGTKCFNLIKSDGHEIAWHGATHLPLDYTCTSESFNLEMMIYSNLSSYVGPVSNTIVFPRNRIGNLDKLAGYGFNIYRDSLPRGVYSKIKGIFNEIYPFDHRAADIPRQYGGWYISPAGHFLNWRNGYRTLIPTCATIKRWNKLLRIAIETGGYVHMWFHPHNLITSPSMRFAFNDIIKTVDSYRKSGDIEILTISDSVSQKEFKL